MKNTLLKILVANFALILSQEVLAACQYDDFDAWKDCFVKDKLSIRMNSVDLEVFKQAKFIERVIELDKKQPEKDLTFQRYQKLIAIDKKIARSKAYLNANRVLLEAVSAKYGVEPEFIVALVAMESDLGERQGSFNIIDSLASLSYEGRRKEFFEKELLNVLMIANNESLGYESFNGSWAGAMGQCQFMPSSYLAYAVDYDEDGVRDIWNNKKDVFASVANYLAKNGWKQGNSSVKEVSINAKKQPKNKNLIFMEKNGIIHAAFDVESNYNVLMKWNRSKYFVISVMQIAKALK